MGKTIAERVLEVLRAAPEPMDINQIQQAGNFPSLRQVHAAVGAMSEGDDCILYASQREGEWVLLDTGPHRLGIWEYAIILRPSNLSLQRAIDGA